jgi:hypothetical protein
MWVLLIQFFFAEEAQLITSIPLCSTFPPDRLVWQGTSNGVFSVRSAYRLAKELQQHTIGESSNPIDQGGEGLEDPMVLASPQCSQGLPLEGL